MQRLTKIGTHDRACFSRWHSQRAQAGVQFRVLQARKGDPSLAFDTTRRWKNPARLRERERPLLHLCRTLSAVLLLVGEHRSQFTGALSIGVANSSLTFRTCFITSSPLCSTNLVLSPHLCFSFRLHFTKGPQLFRLLTFRSHCNDFATRPAHTITGAHSAQHRISLPSLLTASSATTNALTSALVAGYQRTLPAQTSQGVSGSLSSLYASDSSASSRS